MKLLTQEKLPASQLALEIEIPGDRTKAAYEQVVQKYSREINLPGFRRGKGPRQVLVQRLGATRIKAVALEDLINEGAQKIIEQEKIKIISDFDLRSPIEDLVQAFNPGDPLVFAIAVDVQPDVTLSQYRGLIVKAEEIQPDLDRVDQLLDERRSERATLIPIEDRAAQMGDMVTIDFSGRLVDESTQLDDEIRASLEREVPDFQLELKEGSFIPGFVEGIVGMRPGETKEITAQFSDDYAEQALSGQVACFTVTLHDLKEKELEPLDDNFAQNISEFSTLEELRNSLTERFIREAEAKTKANLQVALLKALLEHLEVDLPESLVRQEVDAVLNQAAVRIQEQGLNVRQFFTQEMIPQLRAEARPEAVNRLKQKLAFQEIARREDISVSDESIDAEMAQIMQEYDAQAVDLERLRLVVRENLLQKQVFEFLESVSTIELVPAGTLEDPDRKADTDEVVETEGSDVLEDSEPVVELETTLPDAPAAELVEPVVDTPVVHADAVEKPEIAADTAPSEPRATLVEPAEAEDSDSEGESGAPAKGGSKSDSTRSKSSTKSASTKSTAARKSKSAKSKAEQEESSPHDFEVDAES